MQSPFLSFTLALLLELAAANYECLCSYNVQDAVYDSPYNEDNRLGILYEFDCKPTFKMTTSIPPQWQAIQFEKKVCSIMSEFLYSYITEV